MLDPPDVLDQKTSELAEAIIKAKCLVVYTGAGVSTVGSTDGDSFFAFNFSPFQFFFVKRIKRDFSFFSQAASIPDYRLVNAMSE